MVRRALKRVRMVGRFATVQVIVQIIGFASGILLVRYLDQRQYAYFTIANTMQGTIAVLADMGIGIGLMSIGGRVWQDRYRFGQLIRTAQVLRWKLGAVAIAIILPILHLMLVRNGASPRFSLLLIGFILAGIIAQLSFTILSVVPRLCSDVPRIQRIDLTGSIVRLVVLVGCAFLFLDASIAILVGSATLLLQFVMMRRYVGGVIDVHAPENDDDRRAMLGFVKNQAPNAIFYCVQGQITIFLISFFGHHAGAVAEIGALGRLAMIFAVLGQLMTNIFVPAFARAQTFRRLLMQYATS